MSKFCGKCGASLPEGFGFCGTCGADNQQQAIPSQQQAFQPVAQPVAPAATPPPVAAAKSSSSWLKIVIVVVIVIFAVGALALGGVIYVVHKVSQKAHQPLRSQPQEVRQAPALRQVQAPL